MSTTTITAAMREALRAAGRIGGQSKSRHKLKAVTNNLRAARKALKDRRKKSLTKPFV